MALCLSASLDVKMELAQGDILVTPRFSVAKGGEGGDRTRKIERRKKKVKGRESR